MADLAAGQGNDGYSGGAGAAGGSDRDFWDSGRADRECGDGPELLSPRVERQQYVTQLAAIRVLTA